jgi:hypothetical protein
MTLDMTRQMAALGVFLNSQLPRQLQDRFSISTKGDAFGLRTEAVFVVADDKREFTTLLEEIEVEGVPIAAKLPGGFIALLCVELR